MEKTSAVVGEWLRSVTEPFDAGDCRWIKTKRRLMQDFAEKYTAGLLLSEDEGVRVVDVLTRLLRELPRDAAHQDRVEYERCILALMYRMMYFNKTPIENVREQSMQLIKSFSGSEEHNAGFALKMLSELVRKHKGQLPAIGETIVVLFYERCGQLKKALTEGSVIAQHSFRLLEELALRLFTFVSQLEDWQKNTIARLVEGVFAMFDIPHDNAGEMKISFMHIKCKLLFFLSKLSSSTYRLNEKQRQRIVANIVFLLQECSPGAVSVKKELLDCICAMACEKAFYSILKPHLKIILGDAVFFAGLGERIGLGMHRIRLCSDLFRGMPCKAHKEGVLLFLKTFIDGLLNPSSSLVIQTVCVKMIFEIMISSYPRHGIDDAHEITLSGLGSIIFWMRETRRGHPCSRLAALFVSHGVSRREAGFLLKGAMEAVKAFINAKTFGGTIHECDVLALVSELFGCFLDALADYFLLFCGLKETPTQCTSEEGLFIELIANVFDGLDEECFSFILSKNIRKYFGHVKENMAFLLFGKRCLSVQRIAAFVRATLQELAFDIAHCKPTEAAVRVLKLCFMGLAHREQTEQLFLACINEIVEGLLSAIQHGAEKRLPLLSMQTLLFCVFGGEDTAVRRRVAEYLPAIISTLGNVATGEDAEADELLQKEAFETLLAVPKEESLFHASREFLLAAICFCLEGPEEAAMHSLNWLGFVLDEIGMEALKGDAFDEISRRVFAITRGTNTKIQLTAVRILSAFDLEEGVFLRNEELCGRILLGNCSLRSCGLVMEAAKLAMSHAGAHAERLQLFQLVVIWLNAFLRGEVRQEGTEIDIHRMQTINGSHSPEGMANVLEKCIGCLFHFSFFSWAEEAYKLLKAFHLFSLEAEDAGLKKVLQKELHRNIQSKRCSVGMQLVRFLHARRDLRVSFILLVGNVLDLCLGDAVLGRGFFLITEFVLEERLPVDNLTGIIRGLFSRIIQRNGVCIDLLMRLREDCPDEYTAAKEEYLQQLHLSSPAPLLGLLEGVSPGAITGVEPQETLSLCALFATRVRLGRGALEWMAAFLLQNADTFGVSGEVLSVLEQVVGAGMADTRIGEALVHFIRKREVAKRAIVLLHKTLLGGDKSLEKALVPRIIEEVKSTSEDIVLFLIARLAQFLPASFIDALVGLMDRTRPLKTEFALQCILIFPKERLVAKLGAILGAVLTLRADMYRTMHLFTQVFGIRPMLAAQKKRFLVFLIIEELSADGSAENLFCSRSHAQNTALAVLSGRCPAGCLPCLRHEDNLLIAQNMLGLLIDHGKQSSLITLSKYSLDAEMRVFLVENAALLSIADEEDVLYAVTVSFLREDGSMQNASFVDLFYKKARWRESTTVLGCLLALLGREHGRYKDVSLHAKNIECDFIQSILPAHGSDDGEPFVVCQSCCLIHAEILPCTAVGRTRNNVLPVQEQIVFSLVKTNQAGAAARQGCVWTKQEMPSATPFVFDMLFSFLFKTVFGDNGTKTEFRHGVETRLDDLLKAQVIEYLQRRPDAALVHLLQNAEHVISESRRTEAVGEALVFVGDVLLLKNCLGTELAIVRRLFALCFFGENAELVFSMAGILRALVRHGLATVDEIRDRAMERGLFYAAAVVSAVLHQERGCCGSSCVTLLDLFLGALKKESDVAGTTGEIVSMYLETVLCLGKSAAALTKSLCGAIQKSLAIAEMVFEPIKRHLFDKGLFSEIQQEALLISLSIYHKAAPAFLKDHHRLVMEIYRSEEYCAMPLRASLEEVFNNMLLTEDTALREAVFDVYRKNIPRQTHERFRYIFGVQRWFFVWDREFNHIPLFFLLEAVEGTSHAFFAHLKTLIFISPEMVLQGYLAFLAFYAGTLSSEEHAEFLNTLVLFMTNPRFNSGRSLFADALFTFLIRRKLSVPAVLGLCGESAAGALVLEETGTAEGLRLLAHVYERLEEEEYLLGVHTRMAVFDETREGLFYELVGEWNMARRKYEALMQKTRDGSRAYSAGECSAWEARWLACNEKLQEWDVLIDVACFDCKSVLFLRSLYMKEHLHGRQDTDFASEQLAAEMRLLKNIDGELQAEEIDTLLLGMALAPKRLEGCAINRLIPHWFLQWKCLPPVWSARTARWMETFNMMAAKKDEEELPLLGGVALRKHLLRRKSMFSPKKDINAVARSVFLKEMIFEKMIKGGLVETRGILEEELLIMKDAFVTFLRKKRIYDGALFFLERLKNETSFERTRKKQARHRLQLARIFLDEGTAQMKPLIEGDGGRQDNVALCLWGLGMCRGGYGKEMVALVGECRDSAEVLERFGRLSETLFRQTGEDEYASNAVSAYIRAVFLDQARQRVLANAISLVKKTGEIDAFNAVRRNLPSKAWREHIDLLLEDRELFGDLVNTLLSEMPNRMFFALKAMGMDIPQAFLSHDRFYAAMHVRGGLEEEYRRIRTISREEALSKGGKLMAYRQKLRAMREELNGRRIPILQNVPRGIGIGGEKVEMALYGEMAFLGDECYRKIVLLVSSGERRIFGVFEEREGGHSAKTAAFVARLGDRNEFLEEAGISLKTRPRHGIAQDVFMTPLMDGDTCLDDFVSLELCESIEESPLRFEYVLDRTRGVLFRRAATFLKTPCDFWVFRKHFTRSYATTCCLARLLRLSMGSNEIILSRDGGVFLARMQRPKDGEPKFRLTPNIQQLIGVTGIDGPFSAVFGKIMQWAKQEKDALLFTDGANTWQAEMNEMSRVEYLSRLPRDYRPWL
eukprot:GHVN01040320.1.p1 GENE.GHVN01040320.1~~GHVN01040320.1.p1  ORF type:complete len:2734 (-),score=272.55 GHVN01040320.1:2496-10697(-)